MAETHTPSGAAPAALQRTLRQMAKHRQVTAVSDPVWDATAEQWIVDTQFRIELPSQQKALGESPTGVRTRESVRFWFPPEYPAEAPTPTLRDDFPRDVPHLQPWLHHGHPVPCISDIPLGELQQSEGSSGILNQMSDWLERAALGSHNAPERGWEPARRDELPHWFIADATALRARASAREGVACQFVQYHLLHDPERPFGLFLGLDTGVTCALNVQDLSETLQRGSTPQGTECGQSLLVLVWPGKEPSGGPIINAEYEPDNVQTMADLLEMSGRLRCRDRLESTLKRVRECWPAKGDRPRAMVVVLLARRPFPITGTDSYYELFPYVVHVGSTRSRLLAGDCSAQPMAQLDRITPELLARLSGDSRSAAPPPWSLLGAGSVGSKLALHLARAGCGPTAVIDGAPSRPHNLARHALLPEPGGVAELDWAATSKAERLARAVDSLRGACEPFALPIDQQVSSDGRAGRLWSKRTRIIVNATASLRVRERLARAHKLPAPVVECALFADGELAVMTAEGATRNPSTNDLMAECYAYAAAKPELADTMFAERQAVVRQQIGEGCGSPTMVLSDARVSLASSGMAEYMRTRLEENDNDEFGHLLIASISGDGMSVTWQRQDIPPLTTVRPVNNRQWEVRVHDRAARKIDADIAMHAGVETGGVLIGRLSEICRTINVVDVVEAPSDSTRAPNEFELGTQGLRSQLDGWATTTNGALYCVGTWHNHLAPSDPSPTDRDTAHVVAISRMVPAVLLIRTPSDYRALLADAAAEIGDGENQ